MSLSSPEPNQVLRGLALADRALPYLIAGVFFMQLLDTTIIATSLPIIAADFGTDAVALGSAFTVYLLAMVAFIPAAGALSERFGARNLMVVAIIGFALASIGCALSNNVQIFILSRAAQGMAAAFMVPVGRILVLQNTPKDRIVDAVATITWPALLAPVLGPVLGGWISSHYGWYWNFWINIPLSCVAVALIMKISKNQKNRPKRFDLQGFLLTSGSVVAVLAGIELFTSGQSLWAAIGISIGLGLSLWSCSHLRKAHEPIFDLSVCKVPSFSATNLVPGTASRIAINASPFLLPLLFQLGFGLSAIETGSLLLVYFLGNLTMKSVTTPLLRRLGYRNILVWNGALAAASVASFALFPVTTPQFMLWLALFVAGASRSMQFTAIATLTVADIVESQRSSAMVVSAISQQIALVLAVALSVAVIRIAQGAAPAAELSDYRIGLLIMGGLGVLGALGFLQLRPDVGAETSGHRQKK